MAYHVIREGIDNDDVFVALSQLPFLEQSVCKQFDFLYVMLVEFVAILSA